jgi:hypothetical protein
MRIKQTMTPETFTFVELDKRIEQIPNAPGEMVLYPEGLTAFECIGILGTLMGLLPQLLVRMMTPEMWMVFVAKTGVALMVIGFLPGFVYQCARLLKALWQWRKDFNAGADYAFEQHRELIEWLMQFPKEELQDRMQFIRDAGVRINNKLGLVTGSLAKLGIVPALIAVVTQIQEFQNPGSMPVWRIILAVFLIMMYAVTIASSLTVMRTQFYETLLVRAINKLDKKL